MENSPLPVNRQGCGLFYSKFASIGGIMNAIKSVIFVYDTVTLPVQYLVQRPWRRSSGSKKNKIKYLNDNESDGNSITIERAGEQPTSDLDEFNTIDAAFSQVCSTFSGKRCMGVRECLYEEKVSSSDGKILKKKVLAPAYKWYTYAQVDKLIDDFSRGMLTFGLKSGSRCIIFSETRMEWMIAFHGLQRLNVSVVTLYANLGADGIIHVLNQTEAEYAIVSSEVLSKLKQLRSDLKFLKNLIVLECKADPVDYSGLDSYTIKTWSGLLSAGASASPGLKPSKPATPNDIALIMYTSGSTGVPKGVQLSHRNFMSSVRSMLTILDQYDDEDGNYIAYLPLAHMYECIVENTMLMTAHAVGYSSPLTLTNNSPGIKEGVQGDLSILKPRLFCGVPLVLDRIRKEVNKQVEAKGGLAARLFHFGLDYKTYWANKGYRTPFMDKVIFSRTIQALGGNVKVIVSGGAPISTETQLWARSCFSVDLIVGYSATEVCAAGTCMDLGDTSIGNVGHPLYGVKIRLIPWEEGGYRPDDKPNPRGEILIGGDNVAVGYFKNDSETKSAFKEIDGVRWFVTGDIGELLPSGAIKIIDRRKDLLKLQFGEYISLGKVEAKLLGNPLVDSVCVYGDSLHNYIVALIVPNHHSLKQLAKQIDPGLDSWSIPELCDNPKIIKTYLKEIESYSIKVGLNKYEVPRKIKLCKEEWTPDSGLVTAAMKIRRNELKKFYSDDIKSMYSDDNGTMDQNQNMKKT